MAYLPNRRKLVHQTLSNIVQPNQCISFLNKEVVYVQHTLSLLLAHLPEQIWSLEMEVQKPT